MMAYVCAAIFMFLVGLCVGAYGAYKFTAMLLGALPSTTTPTETIRVDTVDVVVRNVVTMTPVSYVATLHYQTPRLKDLHPKEHGAWQDGLHKHKVLVSH